MTSSAGMPPGATLSVPERRRAPGAGNPRGRTVRPVSVAYSAARLTPADRALIRLAAAIPPLARAGDHAGVIRVLEQARPWQVARLVMVLGAAADRDAVLDAAGLRDADLQRIHSRCRQMRNLGMLLEDMPPEIREGERAYRRMRKRVQTARRREQEGAVA